MIGCYNDSLKIIAYSVYYFGGYRSYCKNIGLPHAYSGRALYIQLDMSSGGVDHDRFVHNMVYLWAITRAAAQRKFQAEVDEHKENLAKGGFVPLVRAAVHNSILIDRMYEEQTGEPAPKIRWYDSP